MKANLLTFALVGAALFAIADARAQTVVQLTGYGLGQGETIHIVTSPNTADNGHDFFAGEIELHLTKLSDSSTLILPTWCTDVFNNLQTTGYYVTQDPLTWNGTSNALSSAQDAQIGWLMNNYATAGSPTNLLAAATQVSIWKAVYGDGNFSVTSSDGGLAPLVTTLWTASYPPGYTGADVVGLIPSDSSGNQLPVPSGNQAQSFLLTSSGGGHTLEAPEPASMALLGAGLVGLGALRRRKNRG